MTTINFYFIIKGTSGRRTEPKSLKQKLFGSCQYETESRNARVMTKQHALLIDCSEKIDNGNPLGVQGERKGGDKITGSRQTSVRKKGPKEGHIKTQPKAANQTMMVAHWPKYSKKGPRLRS